MVEQIVRILLFIFFLLVDFLFGKDHFSKRMRYFVFFKFQGKSKKDNKDFHVFKATQEKNDSLKL
jgi:hypothetical protein